MRIVGISLLILILFPLFLAAQAGEEMPKTTGYFFVAPGVIASKHSGVLMGGGVEGYVYKGLGIGMDGGALESESHWGGFLNLGALYNFQTAATDRWTPFATGGFTFYSGFDVNSGFHYGGGSYYWLGKHHGLRLEYRGVVRNRRNTYHDAYFRIGLALRR